MPRPQRIQFPHATSLASLRGVESMGLFVEPADATAFVEIMALMARKHGVILHAYALADNTGEMLVTTPGANLSAFVQGLKSTFAQHLQQHYIHDGPVYQGRYLSKVVEPAWITPVAAWVHTLPARTEHAPESPAKKRARVAGHPFSSLPAYRDQTCEKLLDKAPVLKGMGSPAKTRAERFVAKSEEWALRPDPLLLKFLNNSPLAIGSSDFLKEIRDAHKKISGGKTVKGYRVHGKQTRGISRVRIMDAVAEVFGVDRADFTRQKKNDPVRPALAHLLLSYAETSQSDIARIVNVGSTAAVSVQIKRHLEAVENDKALASKIKKIEKRIGV